MAADTAKTVGMRYSQPVKKVDMVYVRESVGRERERERYKV
jgi:hypothetical protein